MILSVIIQFPMQRVFAESSASLTVGSSSGYRGDTFTINVKISAGSSMQACGFNLYYDSNSLEVVNAQKGSSITSSPIINTNKLGKIIYSYAATSSLNTSAELLTIQFQIKNNAPYGKTLIRIEISEISDGNFNSINCVGNNGEITIIAPTLEAPSIVDVTDYTDNSASLFWEAVEGATGYNLYINDKKFNSEAIEDNCFTITDLSPNTQYNIQISTMNYLSESLKSNAIVLKTKRSIYQVMFVDWDFNSLLDENTILGYFEIEEGETVIPPENPIREGYTFTGWDTDFSNVTSDLIVQASYEKNVCLHENTEVRNASGSACTVAGYTGDTYCLDCGELIASGTVIPATGHSFDSAWKSNDTVHWHECTVCGEESDKANHLYDNDWDASCNLCGYIREVKPIDENEPQMIVETNTARAGETITLTLSMKNAPTLKSIAISGISYDQSALELIGGEWKLSDSILQNWNASNNTAAIAFADNHESNGVIFALTFKVKNGTADGEYPVSCNITAKHKDGTVESNVTIYSIPGNINVVSIKKGDVNGDDEVNSDDAIYLLYYTLLPDLYPINQNADFDGNGDVNSDDAIYLLYYTLLPDIYPLR